MSSSPLPKTRDGHDQPGGDHRRQPVGRLPATGPCRRSAGSALADHDHAERGDLLADAGRCSRRSGRWGSGWRRRRAARPAPGSSATSRRREETAAAAPRPRPPAAGAGRGVRHVRALSVGPEVIRCLLGLAHAAAPSPRWRRSARSRSKGGSVNSVKISPRTSTSTRSQMARSDSSSLASSRLAPVCRATSVQLGQQQLLRRHVDAPGRGDRPRSGPGRWASVRATVTFCWLPPDSSRTGWPSPAETSDSRRASGAARCLAAPGAIEPGPARPLR